MFPPWTTPLAGLTARATGAALANGSRPTNAPAGRLVTVPAVARVAGAEAPPAGVTPTVTVVAVAEQTVVTSPIRLVMRTGPPFTLKML